MDYNDHLRESEDRFQVEELRLLRELETIRRSVLTPGLRAAQARRLIDEEFALLLALDRHREGK